MRTTAVLLALAAATAAAFLPSASTYADESWPPTSSSDPRGPMNASSLVSVPDVRELKFAEASRVLRDAGLKLGRVERTCIAELERVLGKRFAVSVTVEQMPGPSTAAARSRVPQGTRVALRISSLADGNILRPLDVPAYGLPAEPRQRAPQSASIYAPQPGPVTPSPYRAYGAPEPVVYERMPAPLRTPTPSCTGGMWTARAMGGIAFHFGTDAGDEGVYAGVDAGYRLASGWGLAAFYRYELCSFDRTITNGLLEDEGDWHHVGAKVTYEGPFTQGGRLYGWGGLGGTYSWVENYTASGSGFGAFAELGLGFRFTRDIRATLGVNVHCIYTDAVRLDAVDDDEKRVLWTIAPVLGFEIKF